MTAFDIDRVVATEHTPSPIEIDAGVTAVVEITVSRVTIVIFRDVNGIEVAGVTVGRIAKAHNALVGLAVARAKAMERLMHYRTNSLKAVSNA